MKKTRKLGAIGIDLALIAIAAAVCAALVSPVSVMTLSQSRRSPVMICASPDEVSLQINISWDAAALDGILTSLSDADVSATFAVSGEWAERNPELLKGIADRGHEIATLGYYPNRDGPADYIEEDVRASLEAISRVIGETPAIYCCGSRRADVSARAGARLGLTTVSCTVDLDCGMGGAGEIIARASSVRAGSIIALEPTSSLEKALPFLIEKIKNMGFDIVPTHKMLYNHTDKV